LNPNSHKIKLESYGNYMPTEKKSTTTKVLESVGGMGSTVVGGVTNVTSYTYNKIKTVITGKEEVKKPYDQFESKSYYVPPSNNSHDYSSTGNIKKLAEGSHWKEIKSRRKKGGVSDSWVSENYDHDNNNDEEEEKETVKPKFDYNFQSDFDFINDNPNNSSSNHNNSSPFNPSKSEKKKNKDKNKDDNEDEEVDEAVEAYCFKLVEDITNPSGLRSTLDPSSVNTFLKKAGKLDVQIISFCLDTKLEEQESQKTVQNALTLVEALLNNNSASYKYFLQNTKNIEYHSESVTLSVKNKAISILGLLHLKQKAKKKK